MTSSALVLASEFPSANSVTGCPVCKKQFDSVVTVPRSLSCGHSVCQPCLRNLITYIPHNNYSATCPQPRCKQVHYVSNGEVETVPINRTLLESISDEAQRNADLAVGLAVCCECGLKSDENCYRLCLECCAKKGGDCNPEKEDTFNVGKLEGLAVCTGCILEKHIALGHTAVKFVKYRIRRDHQHIRSFQADIRADLQAMWTETKRAEALVKQHYQLLTDMVDLSADANSSIVLASMKKSISEHSEELKEALKRSAMAKEAFNNEIQKRVVVVRAEKDKFATHCVKEPIVEPAWRGTVRIFSDKISSGSIFGFWLLWSIAISIISLLVGHAKALTR